MTSMVDIMSLLLAVFMMSAPLLTTGMDVELPKGGRAALAGDEKAINISIDRSGRVFIGREGVPRAALKKRLSALLRENPSVGVIISGDAKSSYGGIVGVMSELKSIGFRRVGLKTEPVGK
jgi:biopolymer transport protein TolR